METIPVPSGTRGLVNGTDEAVYALSSDTTSIYRVPMIHGSTSTFPLGATAYPYSLTRGPFITNAFWFTQRRGAGQSDGVDSITAAGVVSRFTSPVPYPTSIVAYRDGLHMYVTGTSCLCQTASIQIGVLNLDGGGQAAYTLPLPAHATAQLYDGLAPGPDDHILWFPVRITTPTSDKNVLVRFDPSSHAFTLYPLLDTYAITGIAAFNSQLVVPEANNTLVLMQLNGTASAMELPGGVTQPIYPIIDNSPNHNLWVSTVSADGSHGVIVELAQAGMTFSTVDTPAAGNGALTVGPDYNIWLGSSDTHLYVDVIHSLTVSPTTILLAVGAHQTITVSEPNGVPNQFSARSDNVNVATVAGAGTSFAVTAVAQGTCNVTIMDGVENTVTIAVTVTAAGTITEYTVPNFGYFYGSNLGLESIVAGPDGNLWFTENYRAAIGKITTGGTIAEYRLPADNPLGLTFGITAGPDGNLWFTEAYTGKIGKITTSGTITEYPIPSGSSSGPIGITAGPDGNLWFAESGTGTPGVAKITTTGKITEYHIPSASNTTPNEITSGPDGNLWFVATGGGDAYIGKITPGGTVSKFSIPTSNSYPFPESITAGPDGNLWFTDNNNGSIDRITTSGKITDYPLPSGVSSSPDFITAGPDGNLWFSEGSGKIGTITTGGTITEYGGALSGPQGITAGPDGKLWFTENGDDTIGKIVP